jgi:hypothetical protein
LRHLELFNLAGIVSFPSFHAASALLSMWALWPVWGIRSAMVGINALTIVAAPVIGAHYIIAMIGGVASPQDPSSLRSIFFEFMLLGCGGC